MNILGEKASNFDVTLLQNNGTDLHSYQPSIKDIAKISNADLFVYVGGESDKWVNEVVSQSVNKNQIVVNMLEVLGDKVRVEEIVDNTKNKNQKILELDSLQSITKKEIKAGRNYLSAMKKNLEVLKKALN